MALRLDERRAHGELVSAGLFECGRVSKELVDHLGYDAVEARHV